MSTAKQRKITKTKLERNTSQFSNLNVPKKTFTVIDNGQKTIRAQTLPRTSPSLASVLPPMVPALPDASSGNLLIEDDDADFSEETRTQHAKLLEEYADLFEPAAQLIMRKEADPRIGMRCCCNKASHEVQCLKCTQFPPLCCSCWVQAHKHQPLHWAHVWNEERGYFQRHDISTVLGSDSYGIPLGHDGDVCPRASKPLHMTLVDNETGVHATKVAFCACSDSNKWQQLMDADLFPATVAEPQTAFTFGTLQHWQLIHFNQRSPPTTIYACCAAKLTTYSLAMFRTSTNNSSSSGKIFSSLESPEIPLNS
ncbi:hypothetical protein FB446DRAFT_794766 [Lentinula raphanica]|nr:hypothetical protein FB446DRAFT_794766 [Lentinula raphanica]